MKNFWALPAFLRLVLATPHAFSVFDDLLAFPQYEVRFPESFVTENYASSRLAQAASHATPSAVPDSRETQELSPAGQNPPDGSSSSSDSSSPITSSSSSFDGSGETYEAVVVDGQRYLCRIPAVAAGGEANGTADQAQAQTQTQTQAEEEEAQELMRATDRGWELLQGMQGQCIYFLSGWWSYSFCYKDEVRQFHQLPPSRGVPVYPPVEDTTVKSFVLGRFPGAKGKGKRRAAAAAAAAKEEGREEERVREQRRTLEAEPDEGVGGMEVARLETKGTTRYMVQRLGGGTECDLTGKERKIEVQFHCHPQSTDRIGMIKEVATCSYLMVIYTARLCNDVAFLPPQENKPHSISCQPVLADADIDIWKAAKSKVAEQFMALATDEEAQGKKGPPPRPTIGGIEVGAQREVGSEGKVIEKSVVVGGGKEVYIGTVASSDGKTMNKEELKKLNIADPKDVEKLKRDLQKLAGRKGWKLDLVDTPRGREFRGIIEAEDDEDERGSEKKGKQKGEERRRDDSDEEEDNRGSEEVYKDEL
ncbi:hypothetical protein AOQ84DRAFT_222281 [Glonium stellatum]|uniref:Endoplasmic reticulum lectin n=1 Tax=Glonium stellatum TaxID=574774 RepID=A0A8E2JSM3_9PEZI|nr:hypothetical protein AOQ84DRAFT_222281 [Glonium stellatum]